MRIAYMPFTHLAESTARKLYTLFGPVAVYQPMKIRIPETLSALAAAGLVELRTPITHDEERLAAALTEFTNWVQMNPASSSAGAGFFGARQGTVPFFDETVINRIRTDIRHHGEAGGRSDDPDALFRARLFLALAQENDMAVDSLRRDLGKVRDMEQAFIASLEDADETSFHRGVLNNGVWEEDAGAKHTIQRLRSWSTLAAFDPPQIMVTNSPAVIETLSEHLGENTGLKKWIQCKIPLIEADSPPVLMTRLAGLATGNSLDATESSELERCFDKEASGPFAPVTLYLAANWTPERFIGQMSETAPHEKEGQVARPCRHTLILLVAK